MPLIQVTMIEGRTPEQKRALLAAVTQAVHESIGAPVESIRAWITDVPSEQFMSAGTLAADRRAAAGSPSAGLLPEDAVAVGARPSPPVDPIMPGGSERLP